MKIAVVDGRGLACRLYYASPHGSLIDRFVAAMNHVYELVRPDRWCVAWESGPSFRVALSADYKGTRSHKPSALSDGLIGVEVRIRELGVGWAEIHEHEADDVMASIVNLLPPETTATLVTDDKDLLQCIGQRVNVLKPSTWCFVTVDDVVAEWGVQPRQIADVLALMGDSSDNVSGVPGIGKKTARGLVARWESLQGVFDNIDQVPDRWATLIRAYSDKAIASLALVQLRRDACGIEVLTDARALPGRNT